VPLLFQKRLTVSVVPGKNDKLPAPGIETPVGDVYVTGVDGKKTRVTTSGLTTDPKVSPDGTAIAYIDGQVMLYEDKDLPMTKNGYQKVPTYFPKQMVVWRDGHTVCRFATEKLYTVTWKWFSKDRIATASMGSHGPTVLELWDVRSGKRLEKRMSYDENLPGWAKSITPE
jgi:hypothetical protein